MAVNSLPLLLHREHLDLRKEIVPQKKRLFILPGHDGYVAFGDTPHSALPDIAGALFPDLRIDRPPMQ